MGNERKIKRTSAVAPGPYYLNSAHKQKPPARPTSPASARRLVGPACRSHDAAPLRTRLALSLSHGTHAVIAQLRANDGRFNHLRRVRSHAATAASAAIQGPNDLSAIRSAQSDCAPPLPLFPSPSSHPRRTRSHHCRQPCVSALPRHCHH
jgi:hypothetical protein